MNKRLEDSKDQLAQAWRGRDQAGAQASRCRERQAEASSMVEDGIMQIGILKAEVVGVKAAYPHL